MLLTTMHRQILGYYRWDSARNMFASNAIDTFDALLCNNVYGFRKRILNIDSDMNNCTDILMGPCGVAGLNHCIL